MVAQLNIGGVSVDVVFKDIKNVHLSVHPPTGRVRIAAPSRMKMEAVRLFAIAKLPWIKRQQSKLKNQEREPEREYLERESHFLWGRRYLLQIVEKEGPSSIELKHNALVLYVDPKHSRSSRRDKLDQWYREQIKAAVPRFVAKYEKLMGVSLRRVFIQRMKTKWGSCNPTSGNIRLNTELAKKPLQCLEYIVAHEMAHLLVRRHDEQFTSVLDRYFPQWRTVRDELNVAPLSHVEWSR